MLAKTVLFVPLSLIRLFLYKVAKKKPHHQYFTCNAIHLNSSAKKFVALWAGWHMLEHGRSAWPCNEQLYKVQCGDGAQSVGSDEFAFGLA